MHWLTEILLDTVLDSVRMLPFLFVAFLLLEAVEHYSTQYMNKILTGVNKAGPLVGALFGCVPQCGFSVMVTNLYAGGLVSLGTLLAVYLATSDEAILILLGHPDRKKEILWLLAVKLLIAIVSGYLIDGFLSDKICSSKNMDEMCAECGCHNHHGIFLPALKHTVQIFLFIFIFSGVLNLLMEGFGFETVSKYMLQGSIWQPFLAALIGFIPNCGSSVLLTELYLGGTLSFASVIAGLCTNAGVGLVVLFRVNKHYRENVKILGLLYGVAVLAGVLLSLLTYI